MANVEEEDERDALGLDEVGDDFADVAKGLEEGAQLLFARGRSQAAHEQSPRRIRRRRRTHPNKTPLLLFCKNCKKRKNKIVQLFLPV